MKSLATNITIEAKNSILENLKIYIFIKSSILGYKSELIREKKAFNFDLITKKFVHSQVKPKAKIDPIKYSEINRYTQNIVKEKISDAIFIFNMNIFDSWILDLIKTKLQKYHKSFASKLEPTDDFDQKQISIKVIKDAVSIDELWERIIGDYIFKMGYTDIVKHLDLLSKHFHIKFKKDDLVGKINEYSLRRNIIVHNSKIVNDIYIRKAGKFRKFNLNDVISIAENDIFEQTDILLRFITDFQTEIKDKY